MKYLIIELMDYESPHYYKFEGSAAAVEKLVNDLNESTFGGARYEFKSLDDWYENCSDPKQELKLNREWHRGIAEYKKKNP